MQEGDILSAREAAYIEQLEIQIGELQRAALVAAAVTTWLLPSNGLPPKDEETSRPHSVSCLIIHHGCRVSQGFFHLPDDPDNPGHGFDEVTRDSVYIDAWMPLPVPPEELWTQYLLDKNIGKKVMKEFMAEAAKRQRKPAPTPAPTPFSMSEADCITADLHNNRRKAPKAHAAQTKSAVALEFKHNRQGVAV